MAKTVVLTGVTGFIAKHVAVRLLNAGYYVRGTLRDMDRTGEVMAAVRPHLDDPSDLQDRLHFAQVDLLGDEGWADVMTGAHGLIHTASPFPMKQPKDESQLIRPAVDGALRALRAARAAHVSRVVLTSSIAAIVYGDLPAGKTMFDESDWSVLNHPTTTAYARSKTMAERAAWDFVTGQAPDMALTVINPALVYGPPLDARYGTSLALIERLLRGRDPAMPRLANSVVDVRDVAEAHVRAFANTATMGMRIPVANETLWFREVAEAVKADFPDRKIATREAPDLLMRAMGIFDPAIRSIVPALGRFDRVSNLRARQVLGMSLIPAREAVRAAAAWLVENRRV